MKLFSSSFFLLLSVTMPVGAQSLPARIDLTIAASGLTPDHWGILVTDVSGQPLYSLNAERMMIPASNAKLAITTAALGLLGPEFTVTTSVYTAARVDSVVHGDLVLYGRGDPGFSRRCYATDTLIPRACDDEPAARLGQLASQLYQRGIRQIDGAILTDGTWFDHQRIHPTWDSYDLGWYYAAPVSGLAFNDNALDVTTTARRQGQPPRISVTPNLGLATITSEAVTSAPGSKRTYDIFRNQSGDKYRATGNVPAGTSKLEWPSVADPDRFIALAFRAELVARGIRVSGSIATAHDSLTTLAARQHEPLAEVRSRPLADWTFPILNASQNLFAEMLLKQLGRQFTGTGSWANGLAIERRFLVDSVGIKGSDLALVDGSGLSSSNQITPTALVTILSWLWRSPYQQLILKQLPLSGGSGTLQKRLVSNGLAGKVRAKTGVIGGVNALSGYLEKTDGSIRLFAIITNGHQLGSARINSSIDAIVREIAR